MLFLPDVYVPCEVCGGKRYNRETLEVKFKGKTISDILDMTVDEASAFFRDIPRIASKIALLSDAGLGYITLDNRLLLSAGERTEGKALKGAEQKILRAHAVPSG